MLQLFIGEQEFYNEDTEEFYTIKPQKITLEHSLISLSKWEAKWKKSFLYGDRTPEEMMDYIRCMTLTPNVNPEVYIALTQQQLRDIKDYIDDEHTATTFSNVRQAPRRSRIITSELIYFWMISQNIPIECEKWHLNRLLTLIRIASIENNPKGRKKMSRREIYNQNSALNAARRAKYHTKG